MSEKVFDELTCPECGGRIGATSQALPVGVKPCSCFAAKPVSRQRLPDDPDPIDMAASQTSGKKLCRVCGKDLAGRSRLKDDKGYICKKCSDAEFEEQAEAERDCIPCPECQRRLKPNAFVEYRGTLICKRCHAHHAETDVLKVAKVETTRHKEAEKQHTLKWLIIAAILGLILLVKTIIGF